MKALVLGGTGFVGRRLVHLLVADGHDTTTLNRGTSTTGAVAGVSRLTVDRTDLAAMRAALAECDWDAVFDVSGVVQAAGGAGLDGLLDLFEGRVGRYVFVSSQSIYRNDGRFPWREDSPVVDADVTTYAGFKVAAEQALLARHQYTGFPATIARPAAIYGPYNNIYDMEAAMFRRLLDSRPILLPYRGLVAVSYGHVDDLCRTLLTMATHPAAVGQAFNVSTSTVTSAAYIATLAAVVGRPADVVSVPDEVIDAATGALCCRLFLPRHHGMLDVTKSRDLLGAVPAYDLHRGHVQTFAWWREHTAAGTTPDAVDPMWERGHDFDYESTIAARIRGSRARSRHE